LRAGFSAYGAAGLACGARVIYPSGEVKTVLISSGLVPGVELVENQGRCTASAVLTSSGTMSLHCALAGLPGAIVYRANPITYWLGRMLVKIPYLGINNLLLKKAMYPEYIQGAATPARLAAELRDCLGNPARQAETQAQAEQLRTILRQPASGTVAEWIVRCGGF
jgi:lipid-A-disaccharide synthase